MAKRNTVNTGRRSFLRNAGAAGLVLGTGTAGALATDYLTQQRVKGAPANVKRAVFVNLLGGADGLNIVIPTSLARYYDRRPAIAVDSNTPGSADPLSLNVGPAANSLYGLHPSMDNMHQLWQDGDLAIINQVGYPSANLSHFRSMDIWSWAVRGQFAPLGIEPSGWIARYSAHHATTPTGVVSFRVGRPLDFVGAGNPLVLNRLVNFKLDGESNSNFADNHELQGDVVLDVLQNSTFANENQQLAANLIDTSYNVAVDAQSALGTYNSSANYLSQDGTANPRLRDPGYGLQDAAVLVQAGFDTQIFYTGIGGWDHHSNIIAAQEQRIRWLDDGIGGFVQDMKDMGQWDNTAIIVFSEFGRRNFENGSEGTDHGHGNMMLVMGGAVNGGVYGPDITTADIELNWLSYKVDFREIFHQVVGNHLNADTMPIFPESFQMANIGNLFS